MISGNRRANRQLYLKFGRFALAGGVAYDRAGENVSAGNAPCPQWRHSTGGRKAVGQASCGEWRH